ncbi:MAG: glycosyltransferase family 2 protein [Candidatus Aminicenantes bacterium]|nr:MAG: glycosyltransferase family 2 protein [Candidatus Aminicenantes bacterium]
MRDIFLSVVIPAYNESRVIVNTLREISDYLNKQAYSYEIIVIDDASTDDTKQKVLDFSRGNEKIKLLSNKHNEKKGASVKKGVLSAKGNYVTYLDADYAYPINQIDRFLNILEDATDIVIGNRIHPDTTYIVKPSWFNYIYRRFLMSRIFNMGVRSILLKDISDSQCGIKCFQTETAKSIFKKVTVSNFAFDVEVLYIAQKNGKKITQIPVIYNYIDEPSSVQLFKDTFRMLKSLIQIKLNGWRKKYTLDSVSPERTKSKKP